MALAPSVATPAAATGSAAAGLPVAAAASVRVRPPWVVRVVQPYSDRAPPYQGYQGYQGYQESGLGMGASGSLPDIPDSTQVSPAKAACQWRGLGRGPPRSRCQRRCIGRCWQQGPDHKFLPGPPDAGLCGNLKLGSLSELELEV